MGDHPRYVFSGLAHRVSIFSWWKKPLATHKCPYSRITQQSCHFTREKLKKRKSNAAFVRGEHIVIYARVDRLDETRFLDPNVSHVLVAGIFYAPGYFKRNVSEQRPNANE